ncbi:MAG: hypothetical protein SPL00_05255 [Bacilli bacterium]|nr:hypothetical protein [Bacilli bacterium]
MPKSKAKISLSTKLFMVGVCLTILSIVVLLITGAANLIPFNTKVNGEAYGISPGLWYYFQSFNIDFGWTGTGRTVWHKVDVLEMIVVNLEFVFFLLALVLLIVKLKRKEFKEIPAILLSVLGVMYVAYLLISVIRFNEMGMLWRASYAAYLVVNTIAIAGVVLLILPSIMETNALISKRLGAEEEKEEEKPVEEKAVEEKPALAEEDIERIVKEYLARHEEEKHQEKKEIPAERVVIVKEVPVEVKPEPKPEPAPVKEEKKEEVEEDPFAFNKKRSRTASFETKLKKSEYELRHQYYDLRDYIKSYGVKNRISIPGDSFSAHRERLVFITVSGKHLKVCYALKPEDYLESPIPVKRNESKKYADVPCELHVKSGLSFRRALKLVDDLMAQKGYTKEEEKK